MDPPQEHWILLVSHGGFPRHSVLKAQLRWTSKARGHQVLETNLVPPLQSRWCHQCPLFHDSKFSADVLPNASTSTLDRGIRHLAHTVWAQSYAKIRCSELETEQLLLDRVHFRLSSEELLLAESIRCLSFQPFLSTAELLQLALQDDNHALTFLRVSVSKLLLLTENTFRISVTSRKDSIPKKILVRKEATQSRCWLVFFNVHPRHLISRIQCGLGITPKFVAASLT